MKSDYMNERLVARSAELTANAEQLERINKAILANNPEIFAMLDFGKALDSADRGAIENAAVHLREAADEIDTLARNLQPYSVPEFYRRLPPSSALEDGGKLADDALNYVFSE